MSLRARAFCLCDNEIYVRSMFYFKNKIEMVMPNHLTKEYFICNIIMRNLSIGLFNISGYFVDVIVG